MPNRDQDDEETGYHADAPKSARRARRDDDEDEDDRPRRRRSKADDDGGMSTIIPFRNVPALSAYYCAVFGLIPCVGFILGLVAVVLGFMGLSRANQDDQARGRVHAWIGIILGGLEVVGHIAVVGILILVPLLSRR